MIGVLEGILFVVGDEGITKQQICDILELELNKIEELINSLSLEYEQDNHGFRIEQFGDRLKLVTKREHKEYYQKLIESEDNNLSQAALETLAIIAYNDSVTRVKIEEIRGVSSSHVIRKLLSRELIEEKGRSDAPGRPILYGTTSQFLDYFGLKDLNQLPQIDEVDEGPSDLFESKYVENN